MALAVLPMVELVEVAEAVLETSDHLGTHPDRFLFKYQEALGYPQRPRQAQPWGVQQVQLESIKN